MPNRKQRLHVGAARNGIPMHWENIQRLRRRMLRGFQRKVRAHGYGIVNRIGGGSGRRLQRD